jgi:Cd2+/Zn2+-exporting ATPase
MGEKLNKKQKQMLLRILVTVVLYAGLLLLTKLNLIPILNQAPFSAIAFLIPYAVIGWDIVYKAFRNIKNGQVFDENFLMFIATVGAFFIEEYSEAVAVMLFYQVGELFQSYAVARSRESISAMMDICPEYANIEEDGELKQVDPDDVSVGDIIIVKAGERIPLDGTVVFGESMVDTSALTGESVPRKVSAGSELISGCVNGDGLLRVEVTKEFEDSTVTKILELVENASSRKAKTENFITKFAKYYTPIVVIAALVLAIIPPLFFSQPWGDWVIRACTFLVISCPCALVISVPLGFFGGIGAASKYGVLVKGSNYLEILADMDTIVFDKTGTLTKGEFKVSLVSPAGVSKEELLELAALAEGYSDHPIAKSICEAYGKKPELERVENTENFPGRGILAVIDGKKVLAGNEKLMKENGIACQEVSKAGTVVYLAKEGAFLGSILISDTVKPEAEKTIRDLKRIGVKKTVMLTGDRKEIGEEVAKELGMDMVYTELLPQDKVAKVEELLAQEPEKGKLAFVGDGINDAPVLSRADIGIAMGSMGSDAAIEAADIVLMDDDTSKIAYVVDVARKTLRIVKENIVFALFVKLVVLVLGAFGKANMWEAVFADVGVSVIAILNAMRAMKIDKKRD